MLTDAAAANTPWLVPVRTALLERIDRAQTALESTVDRGRDQWTHAIAATQERIQGHIQDGLNPWIDRWNGAWSDAIADGQTRAIAHFDAIAETLTALRKLRPDAFRDHLTDLGHTWIDGHPLGAWALGHPLWSVGLLLVILSLLSGLIGFVGSWLGRSLVALPIILGRSLAQRLHRPDLAAIDQTFERLYGDRFTPAPRDRLGKAIARLEALNREQAALLAEIQTLSGQRPPLTPATDPGDRLSPRP
ncbi:MAG: hypothetical protein Fur0042_08600 [Cyanophyceae cyanobacterium]